MIQKILGLEISVVIENEDGSFTEPSITLYNEDIIKRIPNDIINELLKKGLPEIYSERDENK